MNASASRIRLALAAALTAAGLSATAAQDTRAEPGEQLLYGSCLTCHDLRPIETRALDGDGWLKEVRSMIEKGAEIKADDEPVLVEYLVLHHGPLPDGPGKDVLLNVCTRCHDLQRVRRQRTTAEGWGETLSAMLNEGAELSDEDFPILLRYLARNFGPER